MVEHAAVNRGVVGSSPTRGGKGKPVDINVYGFFVSPKKAGIECYMNEKQAKNVSQ